MLNLKGMSAHEDSALIFLGPQTTGELHTHTPPPTHKHTHPTLPKQITFTDLDYVHIIIVGQIPIPLHAP